MARALVICAHRTLSMPTFASVLQAIGSVEPWRILMETGDALISRARSSAASQWLMRCPDDDVLVMTDDDFVFTAAGLDALVALAREKRGIAAGVTSLRSGEYTAIVPLDGEDRVAEPWVDPSSLPREVKWAGGLIAYHRDVFERLSHTMPLLHKNDSIAAFWPFFAPAMASVDGQDQYLSEDYACHERARKEGFSVWVQPACQVGHLSEVLVTGNNMEQVRAIYNEAEPLAYAT